MKTDTVINFLAKAEHDLGTAELIHKDKPEFTDTITFHSQQTIEKVLKAYLSFHKIKVKSNHDLVVLFEDCSKIDPAFSNFSMPSIIELNDVGISVRYSDISKDPKEEEAFHFLELAREVREYVLESLISKGLKY